MQKLNYTDQAELSEKALRIYERSDFEICPNGSSYDIKVGDEIVRDRLSIREVETFLIGDSVEEVEEEEIVPEDRKCPFLTTQYYEVTSQFTNTYTIKEVLGADCIKEKCMAWSKGTCKRMNS